MENLYYIYDLTSEDGKRGFQTRKDCLKYIRQYAYPGDKIKVFYDKSMKKIYGTAQCEEKNKVYFYIGKETQNKGNRPSIVMKDGKVRMI